jgi:formylglycine-generating enzyme required for sulfatase activity
MCPGTVDVVGAHPAGRSPYGLDDMIGNVEEWPADCPRDYSAGCADGCADPVGTCFDDPDPYSGQMMGVRGESFHAAWDGLWFRRALGTYDGGSTEGFRCARPVDPDVPVIPVPVGGAAKRAGAMSDD